LDKGYIHVYTGNGKGKTTSAIGLGIRAAGAGKKVHMIQFMKGRRYSEIDGLEKVSHFTVSQHGRDEFVNKEQPEQIDIDMAQEGFKTAKNMVNSNKYDMIILDEINVAIDYHLLTLEDVLDLIHNKPTSLELVLTGRYATPALIQHADYVSEVLEIKHPYQQGILGRKGVDY